MYQLVESICIENKQLQNLELHNARFNKARKKLFNASSEIDISTLVNLPNNLENSRYKCRVVTDGIRYNVEINPYQQRKIESLKVVVMDEINYELKLSDRSQLETAFAQRENCDDIIIVKNQYLTDSYAANLLLFDGHKWLTPNTPLLKGTQRQLLLNQNKIHECKVKINDLKSYTYIKLINALIDFNRAPTLNISQNVIF